MAIQFVLPVLLRGACDCSSAFLFPKLTEKQKMMTAMEMKLKEMKQEQHPAPEKK